MLEFLTIHTLTLYVQFMLCSKRKISSDYEKLFEKDAEYSIVLNSICKRLSFDFTSLETVSNQ